MSKREVSELILAFINGDPNLGQWEWDDFISLRQRDPELEDVRLAVLEIEKRNPATEEGGWCSASGIDEMRNLALKLQDE